MNSAVYSFLTPFPVCREIAGQYNLILLPNKTVVTYVDLKAVSSDYVETPDKTKFKKFDYISCVLAFVYL